MSFKKIIQREDGKPYLIRYRIFDCRWFKIRIHHILQSDPDCLHDHPWNFISVILKGGYYEHTKGRRDNITGIKKFDKSDDDLVEKIVWYDWASVLIRAANWQHRLEIPTGRSAWTLVIMFKRKREWGFWTKDGFVEWFKYKGGEKCE